MFRFSSQSIVPSKFVFGVGNFGVLFDSVPTTGENGPAVLANDGGVNGQYVRLHINSIDPTITSLFVYEDGSFTSDGYGDWTYYDSKDGFESAELSTVTINQLVDSFNISITDALPALVSSMVVSNDVLIFNIVISDVLPTLQSSMVVSTGAPVSNVSINTTLSALVSSMQLVNVVPECSLSITTPLAALQSSMGITYSEISYSIAISDTLASLQSSMSVENTVPEYTLNITNTLPAILSSMSLVNGDVVVYTNPKNLVTLKSKSRFIQLR